MISFRETVDSIERLHELLKSVAEMRSGVEHAQDYLADFAGMLRFAHRKEFQSPEEALEYIDKVLLPRLETIREALASQSDPTLERLHQAQDLTQRLLLRLQMLSEGGGSWFLP